MKRVQKIGVQGDVIFVQVAALPEVATELPDADQYIVAHSETGHHHVARGDSLRHYRGEDDFTSYLVARGAVTIDHHRDYETHETLELLARIDDAVESNTVWRVRSQRQKTPEGYVRVVD